MEKSFTITLGNGTVLENLSLNGNNYISKEEVTEDIFTKEALAEVTISDGETETVIEDAILVQAIEWQGEYWFILAEKSPAQKEREELLAELEAQAEAIVELAEIIGGGE